MEMLIQLDVQLWVTHTGIGLIWSMTVILVSQNDVRFGTTLWHWVELTSLDNLGIIVCGKKCLEYYPAHYPWLESALILLDTVALWNAPD